MGFKTDSVYVDQLKTVLTSSLWQLRSPLAEEDLHYLQNLRLCYLRYLRNLQLQ